MRTLGGFLYSRRRIITVILLICAVFTLFMVLYGVPSSAVMYSLIICLVISAAAAAWDFARFSGKRRLLIRLQREILLTLERLPEPEHDIEGEYQQLLESLFNEKNALANAFDKRYEDSVDYFAMWAHQIKTPITAMSLALQSCDIPEKVEFAEELQRIGQYVEMALCYIHLNSDESDLVIKIHSLDDIVKPAVRKFGGQFIRRRLSLVYEPLETEVLTDEKLLAFVIEQLISNALKYTKQGSVEITTAAPREPVLIIRDTGIGIAAEDIPRVFERGFTGKNGRTDKRATGIGLYLCKRICERLGYKISAISDEHGTEIVVDMRSANVDTRE